MAFQGNLGDFGASEILQLLATQRKSGCLTLERPDGRGTFFILDGRIVATRMPGLLKDDPLLRFLLKIHRLSEEQHRGILTIQRESNRDLEDLLVNGRYLTADELGALLERQILEDLVLALRWTHGTYRFEPQVRWTNPPHVRLGIESALIEASRRIDEESRFEPLKRDPHQLLGMRDLPDIDEDFSEEERELFGVVDGRHTIADCVEAAPLTEYETYEALQRMLEAGWIEVVGRRDPTRGPIEPIEVTRSDAARAAVPAARSLPREILVGAAVLVLAAGLWFGGQALLPRSSSAGTTDVFAAAEIRDVRYALDLYHRERGRYPARLAELVTDRWLDPEFARAVGPRLRYAAVDQGADYTLDWVVTRH